MIGAAAEDTIFAPATGAGRAAVAVLRISGSRSAALVRALCDGRLPAPRRAVLRVLRDETGEMLDRGLVLWLPGPGSYTGEDCAELHLHGSRAVLAAVSDHLVTLGARPAEPGEFTRRAFLHGRMDLVEAEGIADLIEAETAAQRRQALRQMEGALSNLYAGWTDRLRRALAFQEALIDFPDETLPDTVEAELVETLRALRTEIAAHLADERRGERLRDGLVVAVSGAPNVGKSSLVNALAARDVAIVSPQAGTTRDALEVRLDLGGVPVTLVDTAGLRDATDAIEAEGIRRARQRVQEADLALLVLDATAPDAAAAVESGGRMLRVANKADLAPAPVGMPGVSATTGVGLDDLRLRLTNAVRDLMDQAGPPPLTRARHRAALQAALAELDAAACAPLPELRAEAQRLALRSLGRITGTVGIEDILDTVFGSFCIGK